MPKLILEPCQNCRKRHQKCDSAKPVCSRCRELDEECISSSLVIRYRHGGPRFSNDQPWLNTSGTALQFIDESPHLAYYYDHDIQDRFESGVPLSNNDSSHFQSSIPNADQIPHNRPSSRDNTASKSISSKSSPSSRTSLADSRSRSQCPDIPPSIWSQKDVQEACLMRYFVEELAQWFDSCDASKHFALIVPHRAPNCPALLYAIFSASARHLSRSQYTNGREILFAGKILPALGDETALEYQSLCISHLMRLSGDTTEVQDENLLAAAVILRFYEEVDAPLVGIDDETYLRGTQIFLDAQASSAINEAGLQRAAFWVGFRQEFHKSFLKQRPFRFDMSCCNTSTYRMLDSVDDFTWANRIILHCADALMYCYTDENHTLKRYEELWEFNQQWKELTPSTFNPIYVKEPDRARGGVFPELWYLDDCIVTAIQHWHLAKILLTVFDPRIPRMGPGRKASVAEREVEIKRNVFGLCGIALSNKTAPALITACMGVSMCGDRMTDRFEQEALYDVLVKTEEVHALSTASAREHLTDAWGWNTSNEIDHLDC